MMPELLAPAGDIAAIETAIYFGADAVYCGGPSLQLRSNKVGFDREGLEKAVSFVHRNGKKLYVTVNSFAFDNEIDLVPEYAGFLKDIGVDAVIVADIGVLSSIHRSVPGLPIHVSTQFNSMNHMTALTLKDLGAERIVLARELSIENIKELRRRLPEDLELEAFVHGAMCMAFSGRCIMSSYMTGRSGNRGECTQPCRWSYTLQEEKRPGEYFPIEETENGTAILSSHDMCAVELLDELEDAGIVSYKIEGRMKSEYYVATVVNAYRMKMAGLWDDKTCKEELDKITHRPYSTGFYHGYEKNRPFNDGMYRQSCVFAARVLEVNGSSAIIEQRNAFAANDPLEILAPGPERRSFIPGRMLDTDGNAVENATLVKQKLIIDNSVGLKPGDIIRKNVPLKVY